MTSFTSVTCPFCNAGVDQICRTNTGEVAQYTHVKRKLLYYHTWAQQQNRANSE